LIVKKRVFPQRIRINEAILRRLPLHHTKRNDVIQDSMETMAGHRGEEALDYYTSLLHDDEFYSIQGIRLKTGDTHFQMDSLLLSPSFALITESKNIAGTLTFHSSFSQMDRTLNDQIDTFEDPLSQAKRHRLLLQKWLRLNHFPAIPIEYLVFSSNPSTALRNPSNDLEVYERVCPPGKIIFKIEDFLSKYKKEAISIKELKKLSKTLLKCDVPPPSHHHLFKIPAEDYHTGVQCPSCSLYAMERYSGTWNCPHCRATSKDAHIQAVEDYFILISDTITNKQSREFLHIESPKLANKLLASMKLKKHGFTKDSFYTKP
jgi:ribosomal protein L37AE/L43A